MAEGIRSRLGLALFVVLLPAGLLAQTDCEKGNGPLNFALPKDLTSEALIQKFGAAESVTKAARNHYSYTQDVRVQTLVANAVDGEFHEVTNISYDDKGKRIENVTFAEQSTLRRIALTPEDLEDIHTFMPFMLPSEDLRQYNLRYAGQQHVDELDTYVIHVEPRKLERNKRYFEGRVWVDSRDFQIVKTCGKTVPNVVQVKKNQRQDLRPMFVTYRQEVDGHYWFPAYSRADDTLQFKTGAVHIREVVKYTDYKRVGGPSVRP